MKVKNWNKVISDFSKAKPILYNTSLSKIAGSSVAGLFMSQLLYWWEKGRDKHWIFKTQKELELEIGLNRSEQDRSIKKWCELKALTVKLKGVPPRRHFQIHIEILVDLLKKTGQFAELSKLNSSPLQHITESTQKITQKNTQKDFNKNYQDGNKATSPEHIKNSLMSILINMLKPYFTSNDIQRAIKNIKDNGNTPDPKSVKQLLKELSTRGEVKPLKEINW